MANASNTALPSMIVSPGDLRRLGRELEILDDVLHQASLRQGGKTVKLPPTTTLLDDVASSNKLNLLQKDDRERLRKYLQLLMQKAPVLHISFASQPTAAFMDKLVLWLRANIHSQVLVRVGLQPSITAGCIIRTANKQFDFSLRRSFDDNKDTLINLLKSEKSA